ncbi:hypothetical protein M407DRAFT_123303 [Tulasnella calospora MUT 4182]|uniref:HTH TFE/IIEalpha-type domain-containing protein n=1 Tax=Tulasnella calospora MUT 4182 TaxID=1051891 RepID=A0A0C3QBQ1_9AGAM|nr:hypothetical protein M407DRAFT_123303 [Tulasnella calospora MUT 4182]
MARHAAEDERHRTMRNLIMFVGRAFYDTRFVVVLDQLARHEVLRDDELASRVGLSNKDLTKLTTRLITDGLVTVYRQNTSRTGETMGRITQKGFYYVDHSRFCNIVKWRIAAMRRMIDDTLRNELAQQGFRCPQCGKTFHSLDVMHLARPGGLFCDQCDHELVDNASHEDVKSREDRMLRFNAQTKRVIDLLKGTEEMVMPRVDVLDWIKKNPVIVPNVENPLPLHDGLAIAGSTPGVTQAVETKVVFADDDTPHDAAASGSSNQKFTDLPTWHTHSTITGQITEFGRKNLRPQDAQKTKFESSREAELQRQLEDHKNTIAMYYDDMEAKDRASQAQTPMDLDAKSALPELGLPLRTTASALAVPAGSSMHRTSSSGSLKRKLDMTDYRENDEGTPSKQSRSTSYQSSPPSPQRSRSAASNSSTGSDSVSGGFSTATMLGANRPGLDDPMVNVNGVPMPLSQVTEEHQDMMTPEEYDRYVELVM